MGVHIERWYTICMQKIGAHVSGSGGVSHAPENAYREGCETFQFFIGSPKSYNFTHPSQEEIEKFKIACKKYHFTEYYVHAPYLINLASPNNRLKYGSINLLKKNLEAGSALGVKGVMFHTGSITGHKKREDAVKKAIDSMNKILDGYTGSCKLLIENAAGATKLGDTFKEVGKLFQGIKNKSKAGVCLDTAHAFGTGYNWVTKKGTDEALKEFDKEIGMKNLVVVQYNDSKVPLGSLKDRHEHIADGLMGLEAAKNILYHPKLKNQNFCFETEPDGRKKDIEILKNMRKK